MDDIIIVDYDPQWPELYQQEEALIRRALPPDLIGRIEHIGSTAVPGLAAKPIIDIQIGIHSLERAKLEAIPILESHGYTHWRDFHDPNHLMLIKRLSPDGPRTHHVHFVLMDSSDWSAVEFRDILRAHPDEAGRYAALKRALAEQHRTDREAYTNAKGEFIRGVTKTK